VATYNFSTDFTTNPFTVHSITPSTATVVAAPTGPHQLNFDAGSGYDPGVGFFGELHLPLSAAAAGIGARAALADWYGSLDVQRSVVTGVGFFLLDDSPSNSYGSSFMGAEGLPPTWETVALGTTGYGFAGFSPRPSNCPLATNLILKITFSASGPTFALQNLTISLVGGANRDCGPTYPYAEDELEEAAAETLDLSLETFAELVDTSAPPASGTGQPPRYSDGDFLDSCDPTSTVATVCTWVQRSIPPALAAHLQGEALTLAYCLQLIPRSAWDFSIDPETGDLLQTLARPEEILGFTTHDADLTLPLTRGVVDYSVTFEALNSVVVTALRQELGAPVGSMDVAGLIRSDRVTTADLLAGRYDGAELTLFLVNWASLSDGTLTLARGWWGAVTLIDGEWRAEYRSLAQRLQQYVVEITSATCRVVQLGDRRCKVNLAPFQFSRTVTAVADNRNFTFGADSHASGYFAAGRVIWTSGANAGLSQEIKRNTPSGGAQGIELQMAAPFPVSIGDVATLEAGCDRRLATCRDRFNNVINFRGEPSVPGSEVLKRIQSLQVVG